MVVHYFRCMMCGYEWEEEVDPDKEVERTCPKCRSNSIRHFKRKPEPKE